MKTSKKKIKKEELENFRNKQIKKMKAKGSSEIKGASLSK